MATHRTTIKEALRNSNRPRAMTYLKLVKALETTREQRSEGLLNLLQVIEKLKGLHTDCEVRRSSCIDASFKLWIRLWMRMHWQRRR